MIVRGVKLEWLESFVAFAEALNFTRAADRLHLSQPAVHAQIQRLAEAVGAELYVRQGRGLRLTEAGQRVLRDAREITTRAASIASRVHAAPVEAPVVLAAGEGALSYILPAALRAFARRRPARLRVLTRDHDRTLAAIRGGQAQLGIVASAAGPLDLEHRVLTEVGHVLAMPSRHRLAKRRRLSVDDFAAEAMVVPPKGRPLRATLDAAFADASIHASVEASGWSPMLQFVELGLGVAVVNGCCRLPRGVVARPIVDLPKVRYRLVHVPGAVVGTVRGLYDAIVEHREAWRKS